VKEKILIGLSGGVDSAASARSLMEAGYEVTGCYLALCPASSEEGARRVAAELGIPLVVADRRKEFRRGVIAPFVRAWGEGRTPNPCVECNRKAKIRYLIREADRLGIRWVATGHYAHVERLSNGRLALVQGEDAEKDQSYFLWKLTQKQLSRLVFPLAREEKKRILAETEDLVPKSQKESMEICFVDSGDTARFVEERIRFPLKGEFRDSEGKVLGHHEGIHRYTVGQRRGLGISSSHRLYVTRILPEDRAVVLGPAEELACQSFSVGGIHWGGFTKKNLPSQGLTVRGRHRGKAYPCRLEWEDGILRVLLDEPVRRFAPGQSACFYYGRILAFGGVFLP